MDNTDVDEEKCFLLSQLPSFRQFNPVYTKLIIWEEKNFLHILSNGINLISHK